MYSFCPHCGKDIQGTQAVGQMVTCNHCGQQIGVIQAAPAKVVVDETDELIRQGKVARCTVCQQVVELRTSGAGKALAPHFPKTPPRKVCPGSGKPPASEQSAAPVTPKVTSSGKDLTKYISRDLIRVVLCKKDADPTIEELTLEYLDKADRVRLQIESLRELLGASFRIQEYPAALKKPHLGVWGNASACVVAKKHAQGGYETMSDAELMGVVADLRHAKARFFGG